MVIFLVEDLRVCPTLKNISHPVSKPFETPSWTRVSRARKTWIHTIIVSLHRAETQKLAKNTVGIVMGHSVILPTEKEMFFAHSTNRRSVSLPYRARITLLAWQRSMLYVPSMPVRVPTAKFEGRVVGSLAWDGRFLYQRSPIWNDLLLLPAQFLYSETNLNMWTWTRRSSFKRDLQTKSAYCLVGSAHTPRAVVRRAMYVDHSVAVWLLSCVEFSFFLLRCLSNGNNKRGGALCEPRTNRGCLSFFGYQNFRPDPLRPYCCCCISPEK